MSSLVRIAFSWLWISSACLAAEGRPRNILFIAVDDLNGYVGCMGGHPNALTPNIDRLARRGTLFTNAHCQAPICGPSRASLMMGLRPSTTGIYGQIGDAKIRTASEATKKALFLPDFLESHGYQTLGCGKIYHNGDKGKTFDRFGHGTNFGPKPKKRFHYDPAWHEDRIGSTQTDWGAYPAMDEEMPDHRTADWILSKLKELSDRQDARSKPFIILWSDHGYHVGEKGRFAKQSIWRKSSHVPLIIAGPGLPQGQRCSAPVQLLDLYPTISDLLGLTANKQNEGRSLKPLLENPKADWPHAAITTYGPNNHAVETRTHRYIQYEDGSAELYDHRSDPNEWENIAGKPDQAALIESLKKHLPKNNAPNAKGSAYGFNPYFERVLN